MTGPSVPGNNPLRSAWSNRPSVPTVRTPSTPAMRRMIRSSASGRAAFIRTASVTTALSAWLIPSANRRGRATALIRTPRRNRSSSRDSQGSSGGFSTSSRATLGTMTSARRTRWISPLRRSLPRKISGLASAIAVKGVEDP